MLLLLAASGSAVYQWVAIPLLEPSGDPWDWGERSGLFRALGDVFKFSSWLACMLLVREVYCAIGEEGGRARRALLSWAGATFALVLVMALFRREIGSFWNTASTHLSTSSLIAYPNIVTGEYPAGDLARHEVFLRGWYSGRTLVIEAAFWFLLAAAHARIGLSRVGRSASRWGALVAYSATLGLAWIFTGLFDLVWISFDVFHHSVAIGPLAHDLTVPWVMFQPQSAVAAPFALVYGLASYVLVTRWSAAPSSARPVPVPATAG